MVHKQVKSAFSSLRLVNKFRSTTSIFLPSSIVLSPTIAFGHFIIPLSIKIFLVTIGFSIPKNLIFKIDSSTENSAKGLTK